jgi:hypothetical protein
MSLTGFVRTHIIARFKSGLKERGGGCDSPKNTKLQTLQKLQKEVVRLRAENARLNDELAQYVEQWETLDGPQVGTLIYLCERDHGIAPDIAHDLDVNIQIVESSLVFLEKCRYIVQAAGVAKSARGKKQRFRLAPKGVRYLKSRGLHK